MRKLESQVRGDKPKVKRKPSEFNKFVAKKIAEIKRDEKLDIPTDLDYFNVQALNLSVEEREKLDLARPSTIAAASRIPGVTPSAVLNLLKFVKKRSIAPIEFV